MEGTALLNPDLGSHPAPTRPLAGWCRFKPIVTDLDCQVEAADMCDCGPPLTDAQVKIGASVAVPFSLGGHQVHFEGTISAMLSSSEVNVAFPDERPWLVARGRLFAVVALGEGADTTH